jgi:4-hydroxy-tetrahydrodipicolinate synthase
VIANLPTALSDDGERLDTVRMKDHIDWIISSGVQGLSCLLNSGEFTYLTPTERETVVRCVVDSSNGRVPVFAGATDETTDSSIRHAQAASDAGADVVVIQPRSLIPLRTDEILQHYVSIADAVDKPIGIYNHPKSTGATITPELFGRIVREAGAVVAKDASGDVASIPKILEACGDNFSYLTAEEALVLGGLAFGAAGCCLAMASVCPKELVGLYQSISDGNLVDARTINHRLVPIFDVIATVGRPRAVKIIAEMRGFPLGGHRRPVRHVSQSEQDMISRAVATAELA